MCSTTYVLCRYKKNINTFGVKKSTLSCDSLCVMVVGVQERGMDSQNYTFLSMII